MPARLNGAVVEKLAAVKEAYVRAGRVCGLGMSCVGGRARARRGGGVKIRPSWALSGCLLLSEARGLVVVTARGEEESLVRATAVKRKRTARMEAGKGYMI